MSASSETPSPMSTTATTTSSASHSKPTNARLPSLNQLAAKLSVNPNSSAGGGAAQRPRLAAAMLRTGSTTSLSTAASTADSMAVQAPSTRSASPLRTPTTPSSLVDATSVVGNSPSGGEPLTAERLDKLNELEGPAASAVPQRKVGYKNTPSLEAITARLAKARQLSVEMITVDGTSKPPEAEFIEDPKTPGIPMKAPEHPLQYLWTIYHDTKAKFPPTPHVDATFATAANGSATEAPPATTTHEYEAGLTVIGEFDTVESFCRYFNWLKPPSQLPKNSNYHLFKSGIKPMWEDPANANGGKWVLTMKNNPGLLDRSWHWLAMALVGEELEDGDELCGAVVSLRAKVDRIQVWTRSKDDVEKINGIGKRLVKLLDVSEADGISLEFQYNTDDRPLPNKFLSIQAIPASSYRSTFAGHSAKGSLSGGHASSPTSAVDSPSGGFGTGAGIGGSGWRGSKRG